MAAALLAKVRNTAVTVSDKNGNPQLFRGEEYLGVTCEDSPLGWELIQELANAMNAGITA